MTSKDDQRIDQFLLLHSARADRWRGITILADEWMHGKADRPALEAALEAIAPIEGFHAYPGPVLFGTLRDRIAADDAAGAQKLARVISNALLTRSFRERPGEWDAADDAGSAEAADILPPGMGDGRSRRPYFEVLFVNSMPPARWPAAGGRAAPAAATGGRVRLRACLRRLLRGRVLRGRGQPGARCRRARRGLPISFPARRAGAAVDPRSARRTGEPSTNPRCACRTRSSGSGRSSTSICSPSATSKHSPATRRPIAIRRIFYAVEEPLEIASRRSSKASPTATKRRSSTT